jgi:hypothetical protein
MMGTVNLSSMECGRRDDLNSGRRLACYTAIATPVTSAQVVNPCLPAI